MQSPVYKVAMSIPSEGHTLPEAYDNHLLMAMHIGIMQERWTHEKRNPRYEFYWYTTGRLLTPLAREILIQQAIDAKMDYILMYDDDMLLPIDMVECLLQDMEQRPEIDILAPLAFMRNAPHYAVMYTATEGYDPHQHKPYYRNDFVKNYPRDQIVECDAVGFGAVLIRVSIFAKMKAPYCFSTTGSGEDVYLCYKARTEAKARIFMDTRIKLGHLTKPLVVDEAYRDKYIKEKGETVEETPHKYVSIDK